MYEYQRVEWFDRFCDLNEYAQAGWRLVAVEPGNIVHNPIYIFEREKKTH